VWWFQAHPIENQSYCVAVFLLTDAASLQASTREELGNTRKGNVSLSVHKFDVCFLIELGSRFLAALKNCKQIPSAG